MNKDAAGKLLEDTAAKLGEHFDAVQIMATKNEEGHTLCVKRGSGNWYARQGMAHEFINEDIAQESARQIADQLKEPPEDWKQETT